MVFVKEHTVIRFLSIEDLFEDISKKTLCLYMMPQALKLVSTQEMVW